MRRQLTTIHDLTRIKNFVTIQTPKKGKKDRSRDRKCAGKRIEGIREQLIDQ